LTQPGHWASIEDFLKGVPTTQWIDGEDQKRVGAYDMYEAIYWTAPESFQLTMRGQEGQPLYIPSGRQIVNTAHRFTAPQMTVVPDPNFANDAQNGEAALFFTEFARREAFYSKFSSAKLHGFMRGDFLFHIFADPEKDEGKRISIFPLNPSNYFPEYGEGDDITNIVAVHIAEPTTDENGDTIIHKTTYRRDTEGGTPQITVTETTHEVDAWGQPGTDMPEEVLEELASEMTLPDPIEQIPVYHIPNIYDPEFGWGSSEMRGIERMMRGINQSITDEEISLVLDGLGVYVTDAGGPVDAESGEEIPWTIAPARVIELPTGKDFKRVSGLNTVQPVMDHLKYLHSQLEATTGMNDITQGRFDVAVAESGIALALRMGPILSQSAEKELVITDVMTQMLYDLRSWVMAYETSIPGIEEIRWIPQYGERLPVNRKERFAEIVTMVDKGIIDTAEARKLLRELGVGIGEESTIVSGLESDISRVADAEARRLGIESTAVVT
jgi:hypothetical protein